MKHGEARFLSCMYVLSLVLLAAFAFRGMQESAAVSSVERECRLVILDAGHGGSDGGASGSDGTRESDLNLAITLKTDALLGLLGEETLLVRNMDTDLSADSAQSISQKKVSDIRNRVTLVNSHPEALLVSIHCNTYSEEKYHGAQVFYSSAGEGKTLAQSLQSNLRHALDPDNMRECKAVSQDIYLFRHIEVPGILVECGFLSNPQELENLKNENYQKQLAVAIAVSVTNHLSEELSDV